MRYVCHTVALAICFILVSSPLFGQVDPTKLSVTGYQLISEVKVTRTQSYFTYRASLENDGPALPAITATVTSGLPNAGSVVAGKGNLHFPPAPANSTVDSLNAFTILVDRTAIFGFNALHWSFVAPVANAGPDQTASVGGKVNLNGSGSTNPSGLGTLTYVWSFASLPNGSQATISNPTSVTPSFIPDVLGVYSVVLAVSNGAGTDFAGVSINVNTQAPLPVADAGPNQTVSVSTKVILDGSKSRSFNGKSLTYAWTLVQAPPKSAAVLTGANTVSPSFTADMATTAATAYLVQLVVNDGVNSSAPSLVSITTSPGNSPPVSNAGPNQSVFLGATVQLDGSKSTDANGDPLIYKWSLITLPPGSAAKLSSPGSVNPTFVADLAGTYVAQLIVNDGKQDSSPSTVMISTTGKPTANPGPNQTVSHGTTVSLSGSGTDPQGLPLSFNWTLISKPAGSIAALSNPKSPNPTFVADLPTLQGVQYVAQLVVSDGVATSDPATVTIVATDTQPVANAGPNQNVSTGITVTLDGSASSDAENDPLTFKWSLTSSPAGSTAVLLSPNTKSPTFVADLKGVYVVQLIVNDGFRDSIPSTVTVTALNNVITLSPDPLNLVNTPGNFTINLGSVAGPSGQDVAISVVDPSVATAPATVKIPAGTSSASFAATPLKVGSTNIIASASGFKPYIATINVGQPVITLTLSSSTVGSASTATGTVTINSPAPGSVTVALSVDKNSVISLSSNTVTIAGGGTTGTFTITGGSNPGQANITASSPGYTSSTAAINVVSQGRIVLQQGVTVAPNQSSPLTVTLPNGAPPNGSGVTVALVSSDTSKLTVAPSVFIPAGATTSQVPAQVVGVNFGSATVTASAPGFVSDTQTVNIAANLSFSPATINVGTGSSGNLTLTLSGTAPSGGVLVSLSSDSPGFATVPSSVTIPQGQSSTTVSVGGVAAGTAHITASSALPGVANGIATVNVINGVVITTSSLPSGIAGTAYSTTVTATGGTTPFTWSASGLPAGLAISPTTGVISGTPQTPGPATANITVKDATNPQLSASVSLPLVITSPLSITTTSPLTSGAVGISYSITVAAIGGTQPYTWSAMSLPAGLSINPGTGVISGIPLADGTSTASVTLKDASNPQQVVSASLSITIAKTLTITTASPLQSGTVNVPYSAPVAASGGTGPFTWSAAGLPAGLIIDPSSGQISGTPQSSGTSTANITVKDSGNPQQTATASLSIKVVSLLAITTNSLAAGTVGAAYSATVLATGGTMPYVWSATNLPNGLTINTATGVISGMPSASGTTVAVVTVSDASSPAQTVSANLSITIAPKLVISTVSPLPAGVVNGSYSASVTATGGTAPYSWSATGLPAGLAINPGTGAISGSPQIGGPNTVIVTVQDASNPQQSASATLTLNVTSQLTIGTTSPLPSGAVNTPYNFNLTAAGGTLSYTWSATGLPTGLNINPSNGAITGTPQTAGPFTATVTVKDAGTPQQSASGNFAILIVSQVTITTVSPLPAGTVTVPYSTNIAATGGSTPYQWSAINLPAGLAINPGSGVISGTPQAVGISTATVSVKDASNPQQSASANFSITIKALPLSINNSPLPDGRAGVAYSASVTGSGGTNPYTWSASGLPNGLNIDPASGVISGVPQSSGTSSVTVSLKDSGNPQQSASATFQLNVAPPITGGPSITVSGGTVGNKLQIPLLVQLSTGFSGGIVTIQSGNPASVLLGARGNDAGTGIITVQLAAGSTTFSVFAQGVSNSGTATITVKAQGFTDGVGTVTAAPSGFVLSGPNGIGGSFIIGQNAPTTLTVSAAQLDPSGNPSQIQQVSSAGATVVNLTVGDPNLGTVVPTSLPFDSGTSTKDTVLTTGTTAVNSVITANEPAGYSAPAANANSVAVSVQNLSLSCQTVSVGQNLQTTTTCGLSGGTQADLTVTITSNDGGKLLFSTDSNAAGTASITRTIRAGRTTTAPFNVYGVGNSGTATYSVSAGGLNTTGSVTLTKSGFVLSGLLGLGSDVPASTGGAPVDITVEPAQLDSSGAFVGLGTLAGGISAMVPVTNSDNSVGTIIGSPVTITTANGSAVVSFQALKTGTTVVSAGTPAGYTPPAQFGSVNVVVSQPGLVIGSGSSIGKNLEQVANISLVGAPAPAGGLTVTLAVTAGALSLSTTGKDGGQNSIMVTIPAGQNSGTYYMYGLDVAGSATVSASAPGFKSASGTETLTPSGIVIAGPSGVIPFANNLSTPLGSDVTLNVSTAQLDSGGKFVQPQPLAGPANLTVSLTNSDATIGTVPATVTIVPGVTVPSPITFHPVMVGGPISIGATQPGGYTTPPDGTGTLNVKVQ